jgi:hypothetical protein
MTGAVRSCALRDKRHSIQSVPVVRETDRIFTAYFQDLDEGLRPTVERLIDVVVEALPEAEDAWKWGRLTFTRNGDWHHWLCAIAPGRKSARLLVHKGALLADPHGVLEGDGRYLRAITFCSPDDVDADLIAPILREAAARQKER